MTTDTLEVLRMYELLPPPSLDKLQKTWTADSLTTFLDRYLAYRREAVREYQQTLSAENPPVSLFLDPLDCGSAANILQHALLAHYLVMPDPITILHCPQRPLNVWLQQLHSALTLISSISALLKSNFVVLIPDPCHCAIQPQAFQRAQAVLEDPRARDIWYSYGNACKGESPAKVSIGSDIHLQAPIYHLHLGSHFAMQIAWPDAPGIREALNSNPKLHIDGGGPHQKFKRLTMKQASIYEKLEPIIKKFYLQPVTQFQSALLMARLWAQDRFSTLNPLSTSILRHDLDVEASTIHDKSAWIQPAQCAITALGITSTDPQRTMDFRDQHAELFEAHLALMRDTFARIQLVPGDSNFSKEIANIVKTEIQPDLKKLDAELRGAAGRKAIWASTFALTTLAGMALAIANPDNWATTAATAISALPTAAAVGVEYWNSRVAKTNPLYFLWNARQHGLSKKPHRI
jgi:hypothetical protein